MRDAGHAELARWDELVVANPDGGQILQSRAWGEFKRAHRWTPRYLISDMDMPLAVLVLRHTVPGLGELGYIPKGPGIADAGQLAAVVDELRHNAGKAFAIKVEPEIEQSGSAVSALRDIGLEKSKHDVQISRATIIVDLSRDEDALLGSFKPKARYNIRLAQRHGVVVEPVALDAGSIDTMYDLMASTRDRAGFTLRSKEYFSGYWRLHAAAGQGQLFFASLDGTLLAGVFATFMGRKAWYKDGGSTKEHSAVMAPHLLQWEVMRWLKSSRGHLVRPRRGATGGPVEPGASAVRPLSLQVRVQRDHHRVRRHLGSPDPAIPVRGVGSRRRTRGAPVVISRAPRPAVLMLASAVMLALR